MKKDLDLALRFVPLHLRDQGLELILLHDGKLTRLTTVLGGSWCDGGELYVVLVELLLHDLLEYAEAEDLGFLQRHVLLVLVLQLGLSAFRAAADRLGVVPNKSAGWIRVESALSVERRVEGTCSVYHLRRTTRCLEQLESQTYS